MESDLKVYTKTSWLSYALLFLFCGTSNWAMAFHSTLGKSPRPNIILFYADDLGWTDLGIQGSDFYESPTIDEIARRGMTFTQAYANAANCAPSRACLMSGLYAPRHGIFTVGSSARGKSENRKLIPIENITTLDPTFKTLPQVLQENGYATCIAGKWHLSDDPLPYGFDTNFGGNHRGAPRSYFSPYKNPALSDGPEGEHLPDRLANEVSDWINKHHQDSFFVYMPFYSVHTPLQGRADLVKKYSEKADGKYHDHDKLAAMIEAMDQAIGKVLHRLDSLNLRDNTLIIFTSDNGAYGGASLSRPLRGSKGMYYEGGIRIPFFMSWPGHIDPGTHNETPIMGMDLYPTLLDILDIQIGHPLDGSSIVPLIQGKRMESRPLFWHFPGYLEMYKRDLAGEDSHDRPFWRSTPCSVIRAGNWKLIEYYETADIELFNLKKDIGERKDLSDVKKGKRKALHQQLDQWRKSVQAKIPRQKNPEYVDKRSAKN